MQSNICYFCQATLPDGIYISGGVDNDTKVLSKSVVKFDPSSRGWERLPDMQQARAYHNCSVIVTFGQLIVSGGLTKSEDSTLKSSTLVERYDIMENKWRTIASLPLARSNHTACLVSLTPSD